METIPFLPLPYAITKTLAKPFRGLGMKIIHLFPSMKRELPQSDITISTEVYASLMAFSFFFYFIIISVLASLVLLKFNITTTKLLGLQIPNSLLIGISIGLIFAMLVFAQMYAYPKIRIKRRVRAIDSNLIYALRTMLVQLRSGVSLFDSLCMIAYSKRFGQLSEEIKQAVDNINSGMSEEEALRELGEKNPSAYLRKAIWQIVNGMRAGSDVSDILSESVSSMTREQQIEIQRYGNSLRILSLMYLMIGVIIPALGLTFLIVIGSFPKIQINELTFWVMLGGVILAEFMFMGIMKSKRPNLMSA